MSINDQSVNKNVNFNLVIFDGTEKGEAPQQVDEARYDVTCDEIEQHLPRLGGFQRRVRACALQTRSISTRVSFSYIPLHGSFGPRTLPDCENR